jgi:UDP-GlcNAc:undecaprenyl-phosphate GlcNAc-1-phosphate transferase
VPFLWAFIISLLISWSVIPELRRFGVRFSVLDHPGSLRKRHRVPVPRVGGVGIFLAFLGGLGVLRSLGQPLPSPWILCAAGLVFLLGFLDDRFDLNYYLKLALELLASSFVVYGAGLTLPVPDPQIGPFLSVLFVAAVMNAVNMIDGMDALAASVVLVVLFFLASFLHFSPLLGWIFVLIGAVAGFHSCPLRPASLTTSPTLDAGTP